MRSLLRAAAGMIPSPLKTRMCPSAGIPKAGSCPCEEFTSSCAIQSDRGVPDQQSHLHISVKALGSGSLYDDLPRVT